ncbi:FlgB [Desulfamplus magnetovallimortis]|uniref:Flagellar basal body rod protein FlgB n=1 Tax=Desulfamplus magnetovallimortis TaxID=1246637 RepID=A0A1W1H9V6_9BACT|nr:flagellar basal body rod protein FlgB [Desulfamplus magnetovallimortis]SLM29264.1 FlgB [Desulfamplus magnetovallimortis]
MSDSRIYNRTFDLLSNSLDISAKRHNLIAGNIANMDTIGYKPRDLDFLKTLEKAMGETKPQQKIDMTHEKHFPGIEEDSPFSMKLYNTESVDANHLDSVNIDTEMTNIVENNIKYRVTAEMLLRKMTILKTTIQEAGQ